MQVGDGATYHVGSDRYPFTVVKVITQNKIQLQADSFSRTDKNGISENQTYAWDYNTDSEIIVVSKRKNGRWHKVKDSMSGPFYTIGARNIYQDPSF